MTGTLKTGAGTASTLKVWAGAVYTCTHNKHSRKHTSAQPINQVHTGVSQCDAEPQLEMLSMPQAHVSTANQTGRHWGQPFAVSCQPSTCNDEHIATAFDNTHELLKRAIADCCRFDAAAKPGTTAAVLSLCPLHKATESGSVNAPALSCGHAPVLQTRPSPLL